MFSETFVCPQGGGLPLKGLVCLWRGVCVQSGSASKGGSASQGRICLKMGALPLKGRLHLKLELGRPPLQWHLVAATAAICTHPPGMHSCIFKNNLEILWINIFDMIELWKDKMKYSDIISACSDIFTLLLEKTLVLFISAACAAIVTKSSMSMLISTIHPHYKLHLLTLEIPCYISLLKSQWYIAMSRNETNNWWNVFTTAKVTFKWRLRPQIHDSLYTRWLDVGTIYLGYRDRVSQELSVVITLVKVLPLVMQISD